MRSIAINYAYSSKHRLGYNLTLYARTTYLSVYCPLNDEITDRVIDINVKCKHSMIAGNIVSKSDLSRGYCIILKGLHVHL